MTNRKKPAGLRERAARAAKILFPWANVSERGKLTGVDIGTLVFQDLPDAIFELKRLQEQLHEAKAVSAVCVNVLKGLQMLSDGKITEDTFNSISERSEKDMTKAADWLNEYVGTLTAQLQEKEQGIERFKISIRGLRRRVHQLDQHNQHFERCESGWCNPSETLSKYGADIYTCDPAYATGIPDVWPAIDAARTKERSGK